MLRLRRAWLIMGGACVPRKSRGPRKMSSQGNHEKGGRKKKDYVESSNYTVVEEDDDDAKPIGREHEINCRILFFRGPFCSFILCYFFTIKEHLKAF